MHLLKDRECLPHPRSLVGDGATDGNDKDNVPDTLWSLNILHAIWKKQLKNYFDKISADTTKGNKHKAEKEAGEMGLGFLIE